MGSALLPLPGSSSYGNPTGIGTAGNPVFEAENMKRLQGFTPGAASTALVLGNTGPSPFAPQGGAAPVAAPINPALVNPATTNAVPGGGNQTFPQATAAPATPATTQFGYNTTPVTAPTMPTFGIDPNMIGTWDKNFGKGSGNSIANALSQISGTSSGLVQSFMTGIQPYFQQNLNQILESFGGAGNRFSSGAALAAGKMGADFSAQQQQLMAQVSQWAFQSYMQALSGFKTANPATNPWTTVQNILGLTKAGAGALSAAGVGSGTTGSIIDGLASL